MQKALSNIFYWLRWITFLPLSIIAGSIVWLLLDNVIYPNHLYFAEFTFAELTIFPFIACMSVVLTAAFIAPRFNILAAVILLSLVVLMYPICITIRTISGFRLNCPDLLTVIMQCSGALKGLMIVVRYYYPYEDDL